MDELEIVITSPPEREDFVAEIWDRDQGIYVGAVQKEAGSVVFEYVGGDRRMQQVNFTSFLDALQRAKENL